VGVRIFKFRVHRIPQVLDPLRNGSALMTCTALARAARACSCMVCFSAGHILPELRKFICAMKLWSVDRLRPQKKNFGSESAVDRDRSPHDTGVYRWSMSVFKILNYNIGDTDNVCDNLSPYFYCAVIPQCPCVRPPVCLWRWWIMTT